MQPSSDSDNMKLLWIIVSWEDEVSNTFVPITEICGNCFSSTGIFVKRFKLFGSALFLGKYREVMMIIIITYLQA